MKLSTDSRGIQEARTKSALAAELVRKHGKLRLRVVGLSMLPAVWPGDIVTVERKLPAQLLPGELLLVECQGSLRLHRLIKSSFARGHNRLITRGDSLTADDPGVLPDQVLGVAASIERRGTSFVPRSRRPHIACLFSDSTFLGVWFTRIAFRLRRLLHPTSTRETPTLVL